MGITTAYMVPHPPIIVPGVGKGEEKKIQSTIDAYLELGRRIGEEKPDTIVVISPHQTMYADYFHISPKEGAKGDFSRFGAPQEKMEVSYDTVRCGRREKSPCWDVRGKGEGFRPRNHGAALFCKSILYGLSSGAHWTFRPFFYASL